MPTSAVNHPNPADLNAFGLGKVDPKSAETIEQHLQTCADCRQIVAESSGDSFLGRLRAAKPADSTQVPNHSVVSSPGSQIAPVSSTSPQSIPPELIGNPEYEIVRELGRGGMGVVYLARNTMMGRDEVLKVMGREVMARPGAADRFRREIQSAARLDHPNIVRAFSARLLGDLLVFSMEYVPGEELGALVKARGPLPIVNACYYTQQVANGLQHAHEKGMAHRDIKPANLIRVVEGKKHTVKVLDFGLAKLTQARSDDHGLTGEGRMLGTPDYIAPEQIVDAQSADIRADIYSLGCTLYFLLVGGPPFRATSLYELLRKHREEDPRAVNLVCTEVSAELAGVVAKMMAKDPARRYQTPADVAKALAPFVKPGSSVAKPQRSLPQLRSAKSSTTVPKPTAVEPAKPVVEPVPPSPKPMFPRVAPPDSPTNAWESLVPESVVDKVPIRRPPARTRQRPVWMWPAVAGGAMVMLLVLLAASGAFRMKTKDGVIVLENLPEDAEVLVDGETVTVKSNDGKTFEVRVNSSNKKHRIEVRKDGFGVFGDEVELDAGGRKAIIVRLQPEARPMLAAQKPRVEDKKENWISLFNGRNKTGWSTQPEWDPGWSVENGNLIWNRTDHGLLWTERNDYCDFQLRVETRIIDGGYAQLIVRDHFGKSGDSHDGYRIVLNSTNNNGNKTGGLIAGFRRPVVNVSKSPVPPNQWFTLEVVAQGNRLLVKVNGQTMADYSDPERRFARGHITLFPVSGVLDKRPNTQQIEFRKIEIKELPSGTSEERPTLLKPELAEKNGGDTQGDTGFVALFNGKDGTGFYSVDRPLFDNNAWQVEQGLLCANRPMSLLLANENHKDVHIRAEIKLQAGTVLELVARDRVRNHPDPLVHRSTHQGYMVRFACNNDKPSSTGSISCLLNYYAGIGLCEKKDTILEADKWHEVEARFDGFRVTVLLDGKIIVDYEDQAKRYSEGQVGLYLTNGRAKVRKLMAKKL